MTPAGVADPCASSPSAIRPNERTQTLTDANVDVLARFRRESKTTFRLPPQ